MRAKTRSHFMKPKPGFIKWDLV